MKRDEYTQLADHLAYCWPKNEQADGTLEAGKPNGSTYLDLGGECDVNVAVDDFTAYIHFEAEDGTKGELELPRAVIESLIS